MNFYAILEVEGGVLKPDSIHMDTTLHGKWNEFLNN